MGVSAGPNIIEDGLLFAVDPANTKSYSGSGAGFSDMIKNRPGSVQSQPSFSSNYNGVWDFSAGNNINVPRTSSDMSDIFGGGFVLTLESWVYPRQFLNYGCTINNSVGGYWSDTTAGLWIIDSQFVFALGTGDFDENAGGSTARVLSGSGFAVNKWYHLLGTVDGSTSRLYVNGSEVGNSISTGFITLNRVVNSNPVIIGGRTTTNANLNALVGPVYAYNKHFTNAEILQNYNALKGRFGL